MRVGRRFLGGLVACLALAAATPALASAATVSGAVSDEVTHTGIAGVDACFNPSPETFETKCDETDAAGRYEVGDLPAGSYVVRFSADRNNLKYVSEYESTELVPVSDHRCASLVGAKEADCDGYLVPGEGFETILTDARGRPVLVIGKYGRGKIVATTIHEFPSTDYLCWAAEEGEPAKI